MKTLIILLSYTIYLLIFAYIHKTRIFKDLDPFKWGKAGNIWFKFIMSVATAFGLSIWNHNGVVPYPAGLLEMPGEVIFLLGYTWLIFDLFLNLLRGLDWNYISCSNGKALDEWFCDNWELQYLCKLGIMLVGILCVIIS